MSKFSKPYKIALRCLIGLLALVITLSAGIIAFTALSYRNAIQIDPSIGINEARYVPIGGIEQWVQIRGQDRNNPVLLILNGGPGGTLVPQTWAFTEWEKHFTVVMWDQRGEGKTFEKSGNAVAVSMKINRMVQDGVEVAEFLRAHLRKDRVGVLGFSWGSVLGIHMVKQRPELFYAYVGTGQVVSMRKRDKIAYAQVLEKVRAANNVEAVHELELLGPPPYESRSARRQQQKWEESTAKYPEEQVTPALFWWFLDSKLFPKTYVNAGLEFSRNHLFEELDSVDLTILGPEFELPVFIFQGTEDDTTPIALAKEYYDTINAPYKEFVPIQDGGHFSVFRMRDVFLSELTGRVRPLAAQTPH
jgi:pimeloyl-ACP methyl ester carboxylesterase